MASFTISPRGPFSLEEAAGFGFGQRDAAAFDGAMRLAFCVDGDGYARQAGVVVRENANGDIEGEIIGDADPDAVRDQVARVLSLDQDAREFVAIGDRDPVMAKLIEAAPGLRPPLFYSPYEAAAWSVLSARRPHKQMAELRERLSAERGRVFDLAGRTVAAFPTPDQLLATESFPDLPDVKLRRLHGVAPAALEGFLDCDRIRALDPELAMTELQTLEGIGPFYSALVVIRATGHTDILPDQEPKALDLAGRLYGLGRSATPQELNNLAESWRPFRTWAVVLMRAAGPRVLGDTTL